MTIRRRLIFSNVLMLIVPILLCLLLSSIFINIILNRAGIEGNVPARSNDVFYQTVAKMKRLSTEWENDDEKEIQKDLAAFALPEKSKNVSVALYEGNKELYQTGGFKTSPLTSLAQEKAKSQGHYTIDNTALFTVQAGPYRVYLYNKDHNYGNDTRFDLANQTINPGIVFAIFILLAIVLTNGILTRFVFRSIINPLNILVDGVHEIRDGNLDYRIAYEGKDEFAGICNDFNEMARQLQELIEARKKDDENRRELVAGISHDLRTPLTSIKTYAEGLAEGIATTPLLQKEYLRTIISKTDDLEHIVQQLFLFSKLDLGEFPFSEEIIDIGAALDSFAKRASDEYAEDMVVTLENKTHQKYVEVDPVQLRTVFTNLSENAVKYGAEKNNHLSIESYQENDRVTIIFQDNGPGVSEDSLNKLFEVFYRGNKARTSTGKRHGNGLGLAISAKIIHRFSGTIHAENGSENGLRIIITLPLLEGIEYG
ncbi:MAG: ATP-binding protein [Enterococcus sp.]